MTTQHSNVAVNISKLGNVATGFRLIDCLFPIGTGQRELIIGDRQTGKSTLAISILLNLASRHLECLRRKVLLSVYVATALKCSSVMHVYELLRLHEHACNASNVIFASGTDPMGLQFVSTLAGTALAESLRNQGMHALLVYDDLSKHAVAYRQLSLALRKPAGREAFPSDIFYLHARLLERACCIHASFGGGSVFCLPVIETLGNDLSAFVATNVISITDGQLYLDSTLFGLGVFPAVSIQKSVSRVGAKALDPFWRKVSFSLCSSMNEYKQELESVVKSKMFVLQQHRWQRIYKLFHQRSPWSHFVNAVLLVAALHGQTDAVSLPSMKL